MASIKPIIHLLSDEELESPNIRMAIMSIETLIHDIDNCRYFADNEIISKLIILIEENTIFATKAKYLLMTICNNNGLARIIFKDEIIAYKLKEFNILTKESRKRQRIEE